MVTWRSPMTRKMPAKSSRCIGRSLASAASRASRLSARIISRTLMMRSPSKNMCSVRQRPMPSAPKAMALALWSGWSALVRTPSVRALSAHSMTSA